MVPLTTARVAALPKVELHVHLDTSLSYRTAKMWWPDLTEPAYKAQFVAPARCKSLPDFLRYVEPGLEFLQSREALVIAVKGLVRDLKEDGVIYAEIRFAPLLHTRHSLTAEEVMATCCVALEEAKAETGLLGGLLVCSLRHFREEESLATVKLAERFREKGVLGFDLAGDEANFDLTAHTSAFRRAHAADLPVTVHAGEARGAIHLREALDTLKPMRIGHGVRCIEDEILQHQLREAGVHLEICPGSNIQVGVFSKLEDHPVDYLYRSGQSLSINTDGRGLTATSLTREYTRLQETFGWQLPDFYRVNHMAIEAAFCDEIVKKRVQALLAQGYLL